MKIKNLPLLDIHPEDFEGPEDIFSAQRPLLLNRKFLISQQIGHTQSSQYP